MSDNPLISILSLAVGCYLLWIWVQDYRSNKTQPTPYAMSGTTPATLKGCIFASLGAIAIILLVTVFEKTLGVEDQQSEIAPIFLLAMMGAAITEEVIFRGYLVISNKGRAALVLSIIGFSLLFSILHPYLWSYPLEAPSGIEWVTELRLDITLHTVLSTASVFTLSIWLYYVRFSANNPQHSLLPCFCAHTSANIAVFIIKMTSGYVS